MGSHVCVSGSLVCVALVLCLDCISVHLCFCVCISGFPLRASFGLVFVSSLFVCASLVCLWHLLMRIAAPKHTARSKQLSLNESYGCSVVCTDWGF